MRIDLIREESWFISYRISQANHFLNFSYFISKSWSSSYSSLMTVQSFQLIKLQLLHQCFFADSSFLNRQEWRPEIPWSVRCRSCFPSWPGSSRRSSLATDSHATGQAPCSLYRWAGLGRNSDLKEGMVDEWWQFLSVISWLQNCKHHAAEDPEVARLFAIAKEYFVPPVHNFNR